jgi:hypothetical protein
MLSAALVRRTILGLKAALNPTANPNPWRRLLLGLKQRLLANLPQKLTRLLYLAVALGLTIWVAGRFFGSMQSQLFLSSARAGHPAVANHLWSAPLDDVFIHFDFARSTARGYPFEWSEGNGYSSGGTSLLYPLLLAVGYRVGYTGDNLMHWAGIIACLSVVYTLIASRCLTRRLPAWAAFSLPPALLAVGALSWSLFSGMEVAVLLAVWSACLSSWDHLVDAARPIAWMRGAAALGLCNALLVATRPECAVVVAAFSISACVHLWVQPRHDGETKRRRALTLLGVGLLSAVPGALVLVAHAVANKVFTGEWSAAGALVKLELHHPYLSAQQVWDAWIFHLKYQVLRITDYHLSDIVAPLPGTDVQTSTGWVVWLLALAPLFSRKTRRYSVLLWLCSIGLVLVISLNGQVRWQNERYTMPAVAWLLLNAALGLCVLLEPLLSALAKLGQQEKQEKTGARSQPRAPRLRQIVATSVAIASTVLFAWGQHSKFRDQVWFFGRASRNIQDQHVTVAKRIRRERPRPARVLVGDAGAIPYFSDLPALDIIGLGGYHQLPFARASGLGIGAGLELIQRMPRRDQPDAMAIYPSWWKELPLWFGDRQWEVPVRGNVICGGRSKVFYRADWTPLQGGNSPAEKPREQLIAELDFADLVSERQRELELENTVGYVSMKMLPHPEQPLRDLWDAGRLFPSGSAAHFLLTGLIPNQETTLRVRVAPTDRARLQLSSARGTIQERGLEPLDSWQEFELVIPAYAVDPDLQLSLSVLQGEIILYHLWALQSR